MAQTVDLAVIGGGASGLMAACSALMYAKRPLRVVVLEKQERVGRKLAATGNGRCNLTNTLAGPDNYHTSGSLSFLDTAMNTFPPEKVMDAFRAMGLFPVERDEGRVYPASDQAASVVDVLRFYLTEKGGEIRCGCPVTAVSRIKDGFSLRAGGETLFARQVILAAGSQAAPKLGGGGDGYRLAQSLGHTLVPRFPALTPLLTDPIRALKGCKYQGEIALRIENREVRREKGEILFTEYGLSGIAVMQLANLAARAQGKQVEVELHLLPGRGGEVYAWLKERAQALSCRPIEEFLTGVLNKRVAQVALRECTRRPLNEPSGNLTDRELRALSERLTAWRMRVTGVQGFDQAQVASGGVDTREVDPETMQSRRCPGLYLCGEVLDVDGDCGGFNLQWAWASGLCIGRALGKYQTKEYL